MSSVTAADREEELSRKFALLAPVLDERQRRLWMAVEARRPGAVDHGGGRRPARRVRRSLGCWTNSIAAQPVPEGATRGRWAQAGGGGGTGADRGAGAAGRADRPGRPRVAVAVDVQVDPASWPTTLTAQGHRVSAKAVGRLLAGIGLLACRAPRKTVEGAQHPDRDAPVPATSTSRPAEHLAAEQPVISVDTKKKELVGSFQQRPASGSPRRARAGGRPRLPRPRAGQGHPLRGLRPGRRHRLGQRRRSTTTPPRSRSRPSAAGGSRWAAGLPERERSC